MKQYIIYFLLGLFLVSYSAGAITTPTLTPEFIKQVVNDFSSVNNYFKSNPKLMVNTNYTVFQDYLSKVPIESKNGVYIINNGNYYTKVMDVESIATGKLLINIDNTEKKIYLSDNKVDVLNSPVSVPLDSLISYCKDITVKELNSTERKYTLVLNDEEDGEYEKIEIIIDLKNNRYSKITLFYSLAQNFGSSYNEGEKKPRLEVIYKSYKLNVDNEQIFKTSNYFMQNGKSLVSTGKYKGYELVDQRNESLLNNYKKD